jgi:hypothetical protein
MKYVIELLEIKQVPKNFIGCSVCGKFKDPSEYRKPDHKHQSRTNCIDCYNMGWDEMQKLKKEIEKLKKSHEYRVLSIQFRVFINSYSKQELIDRIKSNHEEVIKKLEDLPDNALIDIDSDSCLSEDYYIEVISAAPKFKWAPDVTIFKLR